MLGPGLLPAVVVLGTLEMLVSSPGCSEEGSAFSFLFLGLSLSLTETEAVADELKGRASAMTDMKREGDSGILNKALLVM